jgi:hypothetical protein
MNDFKKLLYVIEIVSNVFTIAFLLYSIIAGNGYLWANIPLLVLTGGFFLFFLIVTRGKYYYNDNPRLTKKVRKIIKYGKRTIKTATLGISVYSFFLLGSKATVWNAILTALMVIGWVLQVVFDIVVHVIESYIELVKAAVETDIQNLLKPVNSVGNFFKKMTGQEVEPTPEPTKTQLKQRSVLEKTMVISRQRKAEAQERKQRLKEKKENEKHKKQADKTAIKAEKAAKKAEKKKKQ